MPRILPHVVSNTMSVMFPRFCPLHIFTTSLLLSLQKDNSILDIPFIYLYDFTSKNISIINVSSYFFYILIFNLQKIILGATQMSIVFIFFGITFLLIVFEYLKFDNVWKNYFAGVLSLCVLFSYFAGGVIIRNYSFNLLQIVFAFSIFFSLVDKLNMSSLLYSLLIGVLYKLFLDKFDCQFSGFDEMLASILLVLSSLKFVSHFLIGIFHISLTSILISLIAGYGYYDNFGYFYLDFLCLYESIFSFVMVYLIMWSTKKIIRGGKSFDKKIHVYSYDCVYIYFDEFKPYFACKCKF